MSAAAPAEFVTKMLASLACNTVLALTDAVCFVGKGLHGSFSGAAVFRRSFWGHCDVEEQTFPRKLPGPCCACPERSRAS